MSNPSISNTITRKCDICFMDVDPSYNKYVIHILQNHNPNAAKDFIPDKYILESVLKGNLTTKKNCDICNTSISLDVYDYIMHIQKAHVNLINKSLVKYVPDKYVVSVLINKNAYSQSSCIVHCVSCGDEVDMEDYREHMIEHKKMQQFSSGFYGPNVNPINKGISPFGQSHSQFQQGFQKQGVFVKEEILLNSSQINTNKNQNQLVKDMKHENFFASNELQSVFTQIRNGYQQQTLFSKEVDNPIIPTQNLLPKEGSNSKILTQTFMPKEANNPKIPMHKFVPKEVNNSKIPLQNLMPIEENNFKIPTQTFIPKQLEANKINDNQNPNQAIFNSLNNHVQVNSSNLFSPCEQHDKINNKNYKKDKKTGQYNKKQKDGNKTDFITNSNNNPLIDLSQNPDLKNVSALIELMKGNSININFNINNNNISNTTNHSNNAVTTINNQGSNNEEIDILKNQIGDLKSRIETLEVQQSQTIDEHENLQTLVHKKMNEANFKMKDIEKEVLRISELEAYIDENVTKIEELENSKKIFTQKLADQETRIDTIESNLLSQKKELESQFEFLNSKNNALFADKLNQVEKELNKLNLELKLRSSNDIDFSIPTTWTKQSENLILVDVKASTMEFQNIKDIFDQTMIKHKIRNLQRIQNKELWKNFCFAKYQLMNKGNDKTMRLFHGTLRTDPKEIYAGKEEGFDMRYSQDGYFGRGIYFHQRANYSHNYRYSAGGFNFMFVADVLVGDLTELKIDKTLRFPPFKDSSKKIRFDSVKSDYDGIHVVYNNKRAYPSYIIEYEN